MICKCGYRLIRQTLADAVLKIILQDSQGIPLYTTTLLCKASVLDNNLVIPFTVTDFTAGDKVAYCQCLNCSDLLLIKIPITNFSSCKSIGAVFKILITIGE